MKPIFQFKIELPGSHPLIWRRILVPNYMAFNDLHDIIRICMGWKSDKFEFNVGKTRIRDFGMGFDTGHSPNDLDGDTLIDELDMEVGTSFTYTCGSDDRWEHRITLENTLPSDQGPGHPACIGGEGTWPPMNCGGILRYQDMLNILADEKHPGHEEVKKQIGNPGDVVPFNKINLELEQFAKTWEDMYEPAEIPDAPEDSE